MVRSQSITHGRCVIKHRRRTAYSVCAKTGFGLHRPTLEDELSAPPACGAAKKSTLLASRAANANGAIGRSLGIGPGRCCSPHHRMPFNKINERSHVLDDVDLVNIARHVIGCHLSHEAMTWRERGTCVRPCFGKFTSIALSRASRDGRSMM